MNGVITPEELMDQSDKGLLQIYQNHGHRGKGVGNFAAPAQGVVKLGVILATA